MQDDHEAWRILLLTWGIVYEIEAKEVKNCERGEIGKFGTGGAA
ncbi:hypothetical protein [Paenibacillus alginolyticus]|nr:hypothetical protein [Paenibacillus alginolyticus]MEC0142118.1 hypothetical protein [Paenibacillus alginolyticus]